ncbi:uncharacterized domain 1-containing protein [Mariniphaga anaerophila]|uniref:Acyl-coenzyme A thioesterase THEM4 n=1 Tax=Mariniphaga anaerophila TaxID=1484053 RepID=A0A1M5G6I0_9BACT|nr:PaaI family thioesterase [Mariniphaga anaerophila]SHF99326.1 uncharacterized domain 1-containing protein [Mariniphaga anaerophila]
MRKITNPFSHAADNGAYNCFGCSPANEHGLHLEFWEDGDELVAKWQPQNEYEGWIGVLHGGIQATLMDEAAAWLVFVKMKTSGVTSFLNVSYSKPVHISKGEITIRARLMAIEKHIASIECILQDGDGRACAKAEAGYFCFPEKIARAKYNYPGADAFTPE